MPKGFWENRLPLLEVLLLLVLITASITWYGLAANPFLFNEEIRQADVKSLFERDILAILPLDSSFIVSQNDSALIAAQMQEDETVDSSSKYILFCGDSMTEQTRYALEKYTAQNGHKLITCTWYSSTTKLWSETDRLSILIEEYKPDIVWFTLGANELFLPSIASREKYIQDIIYEADTAKVPFVWIGPPNWKDDTGINELLAKNLDEKRFYSSAHFRKKLKRGSDGAHPTRAAAAIWVDSIAQWYSTKSLYQKKLLLQNPKDTGIGPQIPYVSNKTVCAPARDRNWKVIILKATHVPKYCKGNLLAVNETDSLPITTPPVEPVIAAKIISPKADPPKPIVKVDTIKKDTTSKTNIKTRPKDNIPSVTVPCDLPLVPKDTIK